MLTWIKDVAKGYNKTSINTNLERLRKLADIEKMDGDYYQQMMEHKSKRLQIRSSLFNQGENIRNNSIDESGLDILQGIVDKIEYDTKLEQNLSISLEDEDRSSVSSADMSEVEEKGENLNMVQRFQKLGKVLVYILYQAQIYDIVDKEGVYNAFWKNPAPFEMSGSYAFFKAIKRGDMAGVKKFLHADPLYLYERDLKGRSPLIYAYANNRHELVQFILTKEVNVNQKCFRKRSALYYALRHEN